MEPQQPKRTTKRSEGGNLDADLRRQMREEVENDALTPEAQMMLRQKYGIARTQYVRGGVNPIRRDQDQGQEGTRAARKPYR